MSSGFLTTSGIWLKRLGAIAPSVPVYGDVFNLRPYNASDDNMYHRKGFYTPHTFRGVLHGLAQRYHEDVTQEIVGYDYSPIVPSTGDVTPSGFDCSIYPLIPIISLIGSASGDVVSFDVSFNRDVTGFALADIAISGTASPNNGSLVGDGADYILYVAGMSSSGTITITIPSGVATDENGCENIAASLAVDYTYASSWPPLTVTINQADTQDDPTYSSPIMFTAIFNAPVTGFGTGDVTISGSAGAVSGVVGGSGALYSVSVSDMVTSGLVVANIASGVAADVSGNVNEAATYTDNEVTFLIVQNPVWMRGYLFTLPNDTRHTGLVGYASGTTNNWSFAQSLAGLTDPDAWFLYYPNLGSNYWLKIAAIGGVPPLMDIADTHARFTYYTPSVPVKAFTVVHATSDFVNVPEFGTSHYYSGLVFDQYRFATEVERDDFFYRQGNTDWDYSYKAHGGYFRFGSAPTIGNYRLLLSSVQNGDAVWYSPVRDENFIRWTVNGTDQVVSNAHIDGNYLHCDFYDQNNLKCSWRFSIT